MQAKYDATKVMKAARKSVEHYAEKAVGLEGNEKEQMLRRMAACKDINTAVAHARKQRSVILSTSEFIMLLPGWEDEGGMDALL